MTRQKSHPTVLQGPHRSPEKIDAGTRPTQLFAMQAEDDEDVSIVVDPSAASDAAMHMEDWSL